MPKTKKATLLIEKSEHGTDYTLSAEGLELDILIVDYETQDYEDEDITTFDRHEAVITYEFPRTRGADERVEAAKQAHDQRPVRTA